MQLLSTLKCILETSLDDLEFDDAVVLDKRKYCEHMRENLLEDQIIASTFIVEDPIKPRSIKIILFSLMKKKSAIIPTTMLTIVV